MNLLLYPLLLLLSIASSICLGADGDLGLSLGSSATTKLVQSVVNRSLNWPQFIEFDLNSAEDPWFNEVARLDSRNRIDIDSLEVHFRGGLVEVEGRQIRLNSSTLINNVALPLFFLDQKNLLLNAKVKRAYLRMRIDNPASLHVEQCDLEDEDIHLSLVRSYMLNLLVNALQGTVPERLIRDRVCSLLLHMAIDLSQKFTLELPFKSMIPEKFTRYLLNDKVSLRSKIQSVTAADDQIKITANVEFTMDSQSPAEKPTDQSPLASTVKIADLFNTEEHHTSSASGEKQTIQMNEPTKKQTDQQTMDQLGGVSERLLLWVEDRVFNDILNQFRWDFQWINESIQLNSPRLPQETRAFFEVICPQCFFIFNISADGLPSVQIRADKSILIRNRNRIAAAVLNPTLGQGGEKRTAIDLSMQLQLRLVPNIQEGIFRTHMELAERKVEVKNGSAFPANMNRLVEQLIQDLIADDIWPVLQRELEPLIYQSGIQMPSYCGLDPKSAQLHFQQGCFGVSARIDLKKIAFNECFTQFKGSLPDPSKLFKLPKTQGEKSGVGAR